MEVDDPPPSNVVELDSQRPQILLQCEHHVHLVPVLYFEHVIAGRIAAPISDCMLRAILRDWLGFPPPPLTDERPPF